MTSTATAATLTLRRLTQSSLRRTSTLPPLKQCHINHIASFSTNPERKHPERKQNNVNPGDYVHGVTKADLENNPTLQEYFTSNFPEQFSSGNDDKDLYAEVAALAKDDKMLAPMIAEAEEIAAAAELRKNVDKDLQCDLSLNIRPLVAYKRSIEGSRQCRDLRETTNMMPGIIYGSDPTKNILSVDASSKILIQTPWKYILRELDLFTYHNLESRVYDLTLYENEEDTEGTVHRVMPMNVQFHPVQNKIYCCNYLRYFPGRPIKIPIVYINEEESPAIKRGGFIAPFNRHVSCIVEGGVRIPDVIELDCTGARLKDVIRRDRLIFPEGVKPSHRVKEDFLIGTVFGRRADVAGDD